MRTFGTNTLRHGLLAKVKVLDIASGFCFETAIQPEEVTTDTFGGTSKTTMSFVPVTVPDPIDWNAKWDDRYANLKKLREQKTL